MTYAGPLHGAVTVVLVHGARPDGSSWRRVIPILQGEGVAVIAVQNPTTSMVVSRDDRSLGAALQRELAGKTGAKSTALKASHMSPLSMPRGVADVIVEAVAAVSA